MSPTYLLVKEQKREALIDSKAALKSFRVVRTPEGSPLLLQGGLEEPFMNEVRRVDRERLRLNQLQNWAQL